MPRDDKRGAVLTEYCLEVHWGADDGGPVLPWRPAPSIEIDPTGAESLLEQYERANEHAHKNEIEAALAGFDAGLAAFATITEPTPTQRLLGRALMWGRGACLDRAGRSQEAWPQLERVLEGCSEQHPLTVDLLLNWIQSSLVVAQSLQLWGESAALLNLLHELCWQARIGEGTEVHQFLGERWKRLEPLRLNTFEGLMQAGRYAEAAALCRYLLEEVERGRYPSKDAATLWGEWLRLAEAKQPDFSLQTYFREQSGQGEPAVLVNWHVENGRTSFRWKLVPRDPVSADDSKLWKRFAEASRAAEGGNLVGALSAHNGGLQEFGRISAPSPADRVVRWMLLWGKGVTLDTLAQQDERLGSREQAWEALAQVALGDLDLGRPIPLVLTWVRSSLIVGVGAGRFEETLQLLDFLFCLSVHPDIRALPELRSEIMNRFMTFLQNCYDAVKQQYPSERALEFALDAQKRLEPSTVVFLPVREVVYDALHSAGQTDEARRIAREVAAWARENGAPEIAAEWDQRVGA